MNDYIVDGHRITAEDRCQAKRIAEKMYNITAESVQEFVPDALYTNLL